MATEYGTNQALSLLASKYRGGYGVPFAQLQFDEQRTVLAEALDAAFAAGRAAALVDVRAASAAAEETAGILRGLLEDK